MERIVINGMMYTCKNGTNKKISELLKKAEKSSNMEHEMGIAYNDYDSFLNHIEETKKGLFIENVYRT